MTIVIQHRFWDLKVEEDNFSVGLSFRRCSATLHVPFAAVTQFHDPAVEFALTFQAGSEETPHEDHEEAENDAPKPTRVASRSTRKTTVPTSSAWTSREKSDVFDVNLSPSLRSVPQWRSRALFQGPISSSAPTSGWMLKRFSMTKRDDAHRDPYRKRQLRPNRSSRRRLSGRADRAFRSRISCSAWRADAARNRPCSGPRQAGCGSGECAHRWTGSQDRRGDPAGRERGRARRSRQPVPAGDLADRVGHAVQHECKRSNRRPGERDPHRQARRQGPGPSER